MKTLVAIALILGGGTSAPAYASRHHLRMAPHAESFMGSIVDPRPISHLYKDLGTCNGGPCTATGGPAGAPNQS